MICPTILNQFLRCNQKLKSDLFNTTSMPPKCGVEKQKDCLPKRRKRLELGQLSSKHLPVIHVFLETINGSHDYYVDLKLKSQLVLCSFFLFSVSRKQKQSLLQNLRGKTQLKT